MKKIALFGGSFDPFHQGHLKLSKKVLKDLKVDEVWIIPTANQPLKDGHFETFNHRIDIIKHSIRNELNLRAIEIEEELEKPSYTYNTVKALMTKYPSYEFMWVIGADNVETLDQWYRIDELLKLIDFIVVGRNHIQVHDSFCFIDFDDKTSSSSIRQGDLRGLSKDIVSLFFEKKYYLNTILYNVLSEKRADHVIRCIEVALEISKYYDIDQDSVFKAVYLHDIAKELNKDLELKIMQEEYVQYLNMHPKVYHQFTGASIARDYFRIDDEDVLNAIMWHTTGDDDSLLSMITYVADKVERGRPYPTEAYIEHAKQDINETFNILKEEGRKQREKKR